MYNDTFYKKKTPRLNINTCKKKFFNFRDGCHCSRRRSRAVLNTHKQYRAYTYVEGMNRVRKPASVS